MEERKPRILYLDALRLLATFAVIFVHISSPGHRSFIDADNVKDLCVGGDLLCISKLIAYSVYNKLSHWAVPMFLMISGAVFLRPEKVVTIKYVFQKLIPRLAVPYFFWWLLYALVLCLFCVVLDKQISFDMFKPYSHLWFLPMLMGIYLIIPLLKIIAANRVLIRYFLVLWAIFTLLESLPCVNCVFDAMHVTFFMGYSGYYVLGYYLSSMEFDVQKRIIYFVGMSVALATVLLDVVGKLYSFSILNSNAPLMIAIATALFVWFKQKDWSSKASVLCKLQPYLFGIYLIHNLFVLVFTKEPLYGMIHPAIYIPSAVFVVFIISYGCIWVLYKIPYTRKVVE